MLVQEQMGMGRSDLERVMLTREDIGYGPARPYEEAGREGLARERDELAARVLELERAQAQAVSSPGHDRATGRPATVMVNSSPASARRSTSPTLFRSSFCAIVVMRLG